MLMPNIRSQTMHLTLFIPPSVVSVKYSQTREEFLRFLVTPSVVMEGPEDPD